jgi:hypothetical protein
VPCNFGEQSEQNCKDTTELNFVLLAARKAKQKAAPTPPEAGCWPRDRAENKSKKVLSKIE